MRIWFDPDGGKPAMVKRLIETADEADRRLVANRDASRGGWIRRFARAVVAQSLYVRVEDEPRDAA